MKTLLIFFAIVITSQFAWSETIVSAYKCALASSQVGDPDWKTQAFPLIQTSNGYEAATSAGSSSIFELTVMDPSQLKGWPTYEGGQYYSGGNDVFVLVPVSTGMKVIKPLEKDPATNQSPSIYNCIKQL